MFWFESQANCRLQPRKCPNWSLALLLGHVKCIDYDLKLITFSRGLGVANFVHSFVLLQGLTTPNFAAVVSGFYGGAQFISP